MFDTVIVGIGPDASRSRDAIALAKTLSDGRLVLARAYPADLPTMSRLGDEFYELLRQDAYTTLARAQEDMAVEAELVPVPDPSPARALQRVAEHTRAGLIVLASAHHGRLGHVLAGDVTRGVLQAAPCPVAVAPVGFDQHRGELLRVVAGFDGSAEALAGVELAAAWAQEHRLTLTALSAWELPAVTFTGTAATELVGRLADEEPIQVAEVVRRAVADLPEVDIQVIRGPATRVLDEAHADLLVIGSRGWGPVHRIALGSTADHLIHHAPCPLIIVPRPAVADAEPSMVAQVDDEPWRVI
jgi:nucleotide-binding universal stress UspA family protein